MGQAPTQANRQIRQRARRQEDPLPRPRHIDDATLLAAAREVFVEKGAAATTREVARRAGVSEGVLFQRYRTKADLFFAALEPPEADPTQVRQVSTSAWDSLGHVSLVTALSSEFRVEISVADSLDITSFEAAALLLDELFSEQMQ